MMRRSALHPLGRGQPRLERRRAGDRADDGSELDDDPVAHQLHDPAAMLGKKRLQDLLPHGSERAERPGLVGLDQPGIADHVGRQDGGEPSFRHRRHGLIPPLSGAEDSPRPSTTVAPAAHGLIIS